ncbi:MAG TPA: hypothetical protein VLC54_05845 [Anaeromyxobacter sp.]|nr:hypothetical protein [Anaeromyxobacter sp.]
MGRILPAVALLVGAAACSKAGPCPMPLEVCDDTCVDVRADSRHCGSCGRGCGAGLSCSEGECSASAGGDCAARGGGAFVTLEKCGQAVKLWITNELFVTGADALMQGGPAGGGPVLELFAGTDCDPQWTWHVNAATATFASSPPVGGCDVCPGLLERDASYYVQDLGVWCPSAARVVAVDRQ